MTAPARPLAPWHRPPPGWWLGTALLVLGGAWVAGNWLGLALRPAGWTQALWLLALAPMVEELVLRPGVQRGVAERLVAVGWTLRRAGWGGCVVATVVFALLHWPAQGASALWWLLPGALLAETWRRGGRLWACVALHAGMNAALWAFSLSG